MSCKGLSIPIYNGCSCCLTNINNFIWKIGLISVELITGVIIYDWKMFARFDIAKDSINRSIKVLVNYIFRGIDLHLFESSLFYGD